MSTTYRAAVVRRPAGPDSIELIRVHGREPGPGQVLVEVAAAAVNPVDVGVTVGVFHGLGLVRQPDHVGLGWDLAGTVLAVGPGVELPVGARVAGLVDGFDRNYGTFSDQVLVPAIHVAEVPDHLDLVTAGAVPLNALAGAQMVDLLGDGEGGRLLVTGAAGALGANVVRLAQDRGWAVTGSARAADENFVSGLGADFTTQPSAGWDAVADAAGVQDAGVALVRDGGRFVGVRPSAVPAEVRGIITRAVVAHPDGARLARLLSAVAAGHLPARVHSAVPLEEVADAHRAVAKGGVRGRYVLRPRLDVR